MTRSGDAHKFTRGLARLAAARGVDFRYQTKVLSLATAAGRVTAVDTDRGPIRGDAYVLAAGSYSPLLLKPLGIALPVYPAKGYSVTIPIGEAGVAPVVALIDDEFKMVYARLGDRLRIAGTAEFTGYDASVNETPRAVPPRQGGRAVSRLRRYRPRRVLGRAQAVDARRHAGDRPHPLPQPVPQHRPRHPRLDHGLRLRPPRRRPGPGPRPPTSPSPASPSTASAEPFFKADMQGEVAARNSRRRIPPDGGIEYRHNTIRGGPMRAYPLDAYTH